MAEENNIEKFERLIAENKVNELKKEPQQEPKAEELQEEPHFKINLKLIKLTNRVKELEQALSSMVALIDKVTVINNRVNELMGHKVNQEEEEQAEEPEVNNEIDEVNTPEAVEQSELTNKNTVNPDDLTNNQLEAIEQNKKGISNTKIAEQLGISRVSVWKMLKKLKKEGVID